MANHTGYYSGAPAFGHRQEGPNAAVVGGANCLVGAVEGRNGYPAGLMGPPAGENKRKEALEGGGGVAEVAANILPDQTHLESSSDTFDVLEATYPVELFEYDPSGSSSSHVRPTPMGATRTNPGRFVSMGATKKRSCDKRKAGQATMKVGCEQKARKLVEAVAGLCHDSDPLEKLGSSPAAALQQVLSTLQWFVKQFSLTFQPALCISDGSLMFSAEQEKSQYQLTIQIVAKGDLRFECCPVKCPLETQRVFH